MRLEFEELTKLCNAARINGQHMTLDALDEVINLEQEAGRLGPVENGVAQTLRKMIGVVRKALPPNVPFGEVAASIGP